MDNVFSYFFAIGAGLTFGVSIVLLPALWIYKKLGKRGVKDASESFTATRRKYNSP